MSKENDKRNPLLEKYGFYEKFDELKKEIDDKKVKSPFPLFWNF